MILIIVYQFSFFLPGCIYCSNIFLNSSQKRRGKALANILYRPLFSRVNKVDLPNVKCTVLIMMSQGKH